MRCAACSADNRAAAKFCDECGARLAPAADAAVCNYTPKHLSDKILKSRSAMEGEKKRVTVLFCDIKGSTRLAEQAGAETWHHLLDRFFAILTTAVHRFEGTVNQYTGDGIMALFGAPIAHEDHAARGCLAALAMQDELRAYADQVRTQHGLELGMRVGLNSGEVIVGRIGDDLRMDYTAQGATTHLAARMEQMCEPGKIYLSRYTAALVRHRFQMRALGEHSVHGVAHPVAVFELSGEATETASDIAPTPFVGRSAELQRLQEARARLASGRLQVVCVTGTAGLGKSRLCREFGALRQSEGDAFHRAACLPYSRAMPLWPLRRLLRQRLGIGDSQPVDEALGIAESVFATYDKPDRASLRPLWLDFLGLPTEDLHTITQTPGLRARLLRFVSDFLLTVTKPQVLLIEDLHWMDAASEDFLADFIREAQDRPVLLVFNFRPDYQPAALKPWLTEPLRLAEFGAAEQDALALSLLGGDPGLRRLLPRLRERTAGNPFFLEEAVRDLIAGGYLNGAPGRYTLARPIEQWSIPDTVHALLAARMDRLPDEQKRLLQTAAVIGQRFGLGLLASVLDASRDDTLNATLLLETAGFLRARPGGAEPEFTFSHPLMQEVAYQSQLESHRRSVHALLATHLQIRHPAKGAPGSAWVTIAHHWARAGDWARAGSWNLRAALWAAQWDIAVTLEQVRAAIVHLDKAAATPEVCRERVAARSTLVRMAVHARVPLAETEAAYQQGRRIAREQRNLRAHADLLLAYGVDWLHRGDADAGAALTERAADLARAISDAPPFEYAESLLYTHTTAGRIEDGLASCRSLLGASWETGALNAGNYAARAGLAIARLYQGRLPEARAGMEAVLAAFPGDDNVGAWLNCFLVEHCAHSGEVAPVREYAHRALRAADTFGSPQYWALALRAQAVAACLTGAFADARAPLDEAAPLYAEGTSGYVYRASYLLARAEMHRGLGESGAAAAVVEEAIAVAARQKTRLQELLGWIYLASLPRDGHWVARVPFGLSRAEELIAFTGAGVYLPWLCQSQARWAADAERRVDWMVQAAEQFAAIGADGHFKRLGVVV